MSNIQHSSRSDNWGTPSDIIQLVHQTIGKPDLDPASNELHNQRVKAKRIITADQNALTISWSDKPVTIFLNPPGGKIGNQSLTKLFWKKLIYFRSKGLLIEAVFMCFSVEALQSTQLDCNQPIASFPVCIPARRIPFVDQSGAKRNQPSHSNAIVYVDGLINNRYLFDQVFSNLGAVMIPFE